MVWRGFGLPTTLNSYSHCPGPPMTWDTKAQGSQRGALFFHPQVFHQQPQARARRTTWPACPSWQPPCPHPHLLLCSPEGSLVPYEHFLGWISHFVGCSDKSELGTPRMSRPLTLKSSPGRPLDQGKYNETTSSPKTDKEKEIDEKGLWLINKNRPLSLNIQELTRQYLHLVLKRVCGAFRHACCPQNSGRVSIGILANLDQEPSLSARAPSDHKEVS